MADNNSFVKNLIALYESEKREALAQLKQGSAGREPVNFSSMEVIGKYVPEDLSELDTKIYLLIASLYSIHPKHVEGKSYGRSLRELRDTLTVSAESLDTRFTRLLNTDIEDLQFQFRQLTAMLSAAELAIDYSALLSDLLNWTHPSHVSQFKWARDYFSAVNNMTEAPKASI